MRSSTVEELKELVLKSFGLDLLLSESTNLRLGIDTGVNVLMDDQIISDLQLKDYSTVRIEKGKKILIQQYKVGIKVILVEKNSHDFKYINQSQHGIRSGDVALLFDKTDSIRSVRDLAGVKLLGYECDWTLNESSKPYRLRRTNWALECQDIFLEVNDKGVVQSIKECSINDGDTLLLEEGPIPIKGQYNIKVI